MKSNTVFLFLVSILPMLFCQWSVLHSQSRNRKVQTVHQTKVTRGLSLLQRDSVLLMHNVAREKEGIPALSWDSTLAHHAQQWAEYLASKDVLEHRPTTGKNATPYGENLYAGTSRFATIQKGIQSWYDEKKYFRKGQKITVKNYSKIGHYTQLMWQKTTAVGAGIAFSATGTMYFVCNYNPPGNFFDETPW